MSTLIRHSEIPKGHIHSMVNWEFPEYADLLAYTTVTKKDLHKIAYVVDTGAGSGAYYSLEKVDYVTGDRTWVSIFGGAGSGGATNLAIGTVTGTTVQITSDTGADATIPAATSSVAGVATAAHIAKLNGIATGATANSSDATLLARANHTGTQIASTISDLTEATQDVVGGLLVAGTNITLNYNDASNTLTINATGGGGGATNLSLGTVTSTTVDINSDTGTDVTIPAATGSDAGLMTAANQVKLAGIATGATANSSDATLLDRANHTGTQTSSTISDLTESVQDIVGAFASAGTNMTVTYNDGADTLVIATTATVNDTDANLKARANHTGTQTASTISDFTEATQDVVGAFMSGTGPISVTYNDGANTLVVSFTGVDVTDGDKGDITVSSTGTVWTVDNSAITNAKMADMANATVKGRNTAGTGAPEDVTMSQLRTLIALNFSDLAGTIAIGQIGANLITNAKLAQIATARFKGRVTASTGDVEELTGTQATTLLDTFTSSLKGLVPASGGGTTNFLRADGTFAAPTGGSGRAQDVNNYYVSTDFVDNSSTQYIWVGTGVGAGSTSVSNTGRAAKHQGTLLLKNAASANTGYAFRTQVANLMACPYLESNFVFYMAGTTGSGYNVDMVFKLGFIDSITTTESTDGIFLMKNAGSNSIFGRVVSNGTVVDTSSIYTMADQTWYQGKVKLDSAGTSAVFTLYDDSGTQLGTQTASSGLPSGTSRLFGSGLVMYNTTLTTSQDLLIMDFMDLVIPSIGRGTP